MQTPNGKQIDNYWNRYDPDKHYKELLFRDGKPMQASEMNELQSIQDAERKKIADCLFNNGDINAGGQITVNAESGLVNAEAAKVYLDGSVWDVPAAQFSIPLTGTYTVGVYLKKTVISEVEDPELLNPATGSRAAGLAGAWRGKVEAYWGFDKDGNSDSFFPVYTVDDCVVRAKETPPSYDAIAQAIAQYDQDSTGSGTYIASGLVVTQSADDAQGRQVYAVSAGRFRINGLGLSFPQDQQVIYAAAPQDSEIIHVTTETAAATGAASQRIDVAHSPIWRAKPVTVSVPRRITVTVTHSITSGSIDALTPGSVLKIVKVFQGDTTYKEGTDFTRQGDSINWAPAGAEPSPGATYQVIYDYYATETPQDLDYDGFVVKDAQEGYSIIYSYDYALPRIDRLCLNGSGMFEWVTGVASAASPKKPTVPSNLLSIATVGQLWRDDSERILASDGVRCVLFDDMLAMNDRITWLMEELARTRLENDISVREGGARVGLMVDPFSDDSMRDEGLEQTAAVVEGWLTLPIAAEAYNLDELKSPEVLPYTLDIALQQTLRTGSMKINPYMVFTPLPAEMALSPAVDYWNETKTSYQSETKYFYVNRTVARTVSGGTIINNIGTVNRTSSIRSAAGTTTQTVSNSVRTSVSSSVSTSTSTSTSTSLTTTGSAKIATLRQITVKFTIKGFGPGEILERMSFAGVQVAVTGNTVADSNGALSGSFVIPAGISAGTKQVLAEGKGGTVAAATFTGQGTITFQVLKTTKTVTKTTTTTVTTTKTNVQNVQTVVTRYVNPDPLAQTFRLETDAQLAAVDLMFVKKGNSKVKIRIVECENGYPTSNILAEGSKEAKDIILTDFTRIFFDDFYKAVTLEGGVEYALVVLTDDGTTEVATATLGKFDSKNQRWVTSQPYTVGVMLSSSNAETWTAHQDTDLCFRLVKAVTAAAEKTVHMGTVQVDGITDLILKASVEYPDANTAVSFLAKLPDGTTVEMAEDQALDLGGEMTGELDISAVLKSSGLLSPGLAPEAQIITGTVASEGTYIARSMNARGATNLSVIFDAIIPSGAGVKVEIKKDEGEFEELTLQGSAAQGDGVYEYRYTDTLSDVDLIKLKLTLTGTPTARPLVANLRMLATK